MKGMGNSKSQPKRRLTRAGFWSTLVLWTMAFLGILLIAVERLSRLGLDLVGYVLLSLLIALLLVLAYLLRVAHRDSHTWDEEEARRKEWDRRGRAL